MKGRSLIALGVLAVTAALVAGCPPTFPKPPYDTTGNYSGTWSGNSTDAEQQVLECPLSMALTQNINANYPGDHGVSGTVTIDYSCIELPEWVDEPLPSVVNVGGLVEDNGKLSLLTGGCTTALCVVLGLQGQGEDLDDDNLMDVYSGQWSYTILLAGVEPFGFTGTFEVEVD